MNRDQKAAAIAEIADHIRESQAVFAVDYQGISVPQAAELRAKLRAADATFKVVKNSLTERAADAAEVVELKALLRGPTALTFVRGDAATAAKALADYGRATQLLPFKGGFMDGAALEPEQFRTISRLPSRDALYGQLVGVVASPVTGLVRTLGALVGGLAVALGQVRDKKESGEIPAAEAPAAEAPVPATDAPAAEESATGESPSTAEAPAAEEADEISPETAEPETAEEPAEPTAEAPAEAPAAETPDTQAEPEGDEPAQENDDNREAGVSAEAESDDAETNPTKED